MGPVRGQACPLSRSQLFRLPASRRRLLLILCQCTRDRASDSWPPPPLLPLLPLQPASRRGTTPRCWRRSALRASPLMVSLVLHSVVLA